MKVLTEPNNSIRIQRKQFQPAELTKAKKEWTPLQKTAFRIAFIFVSLVAIPLDLGFYRMLWYIDYTHLNYRHLTDVFVFYNPQFINHFSEGGFFGWQSYVNLPFILLIAIIGGLVWGLLDKNSKQYDVLYYWVRVLARYRVAYAGVAWGFKKIFIMQMPEQYEGLWNTPLIDFFAKRLYWEHISVSPPYEFFLGFAEFFGGFLLLFRKTTTIGACTTLAVFGNIAVANHAYDIGEHVPSACMALLSIFILWNDIPSIVSLLIKEHDEVITKFYPVLSKWQNRVRLIVKYSFNGVFVFLFCILEIYAFTHNDFYKIPNTPGVSGLQGYYTVTEFRINDSIVPYSPFEKKRWQDVTFEKWSSMSYKVADRPQEIEMFAAGSYPRRGENYDNLWHFDWRGDVRRYRNTKEKYEPEKRDINIGWEASGMSGRVWYTYKADTVNQILYLQNKNKADRKQKQELHYVQTSDSRVILYGTNEFGDSIYAVLDRAEEDYPLHAKND